MQQLHQQIVDTLKGYIRNIPDFPKPGIQFKDITPLLKDAEALELTMFMLAKPFLDKEIDYVMGIESRGFIFGAVLAEKLNAGFIPVRKPNKLPYDTVEEAYELEYGQETIEMHKDALEKGSQVLLHDDLIATGGSAAAASRMVENAGAELAGYSFLIELDGLDGRSVLKQDVQYEVLMSL